MPEIPDPPSPRIEPNPDGPGFLLTTRLELPAPRETVFAFFADAFQLQALTPPWLDFHVLTPAPIRIERGTQIDYRLRLHGFPIRWRTRIQAWEPPHRFVDEQERGPYRLWHHEHRFEETPRGTLVSDRVLYRILGGRWVHALFVRRDLLEIFRYRMVKLQERFGRLEGP